MAGGRETGQGTAGQGGDDVRVIDGEDQVGMKLLAEILSDMDGEISALEEKLVKAGMMSVLLTGKVRLV